MNKRKILFLAPLVGIGAITQADFVGIIDTTVAKISTIEDEQYEYTEWSDKGSRYDCLDWNPDVSTINLGTVFTQLRNCSQDQERTETIYDIWSNGNKTVSEINIQEQTITEQESQSATGTKNFTTSERADPWGSWYDITISYNCAVWTPDPSTIDYGVKFTQTRSCSKDQERNRDVFDVWADGTETLNRTEDDFQTISVSENQEATGSKNLITSERADPWGEWVDVNAHYDCTVWTPDAATIDIGEDFTQTRDCSQDQERTRDVFDVWADGTETLNRTETDEQTITEEESQIETGTRNDKDSTRTEEWSNWVNKGGLYSCSTWSPNVNTINHGTVFTQSADCSQDQERTRNVYDVWTDGTETLNRTEKEDQTISVEDTQSATGTKDYIVGTITGSWSSWSDVGSLHTCGGWSPATSTVNHGTTFTQTAACKQNQERTRTIYDDWKVQANTVNRTEKDSQTIDRNKTQSATGSKDYVIGTAYGSWSSWSNSGGLHTCGSWSPATSTVNHGTVFTQTAACKQNQTRTRTVYDDWKLGPNTVRTTETENQTINANKTQSATGTKDYVIGTAYGSWSAWSNSGALHTCGSWSPAVNTVNHGTVFTQTAACKQNQTRTRTVYDDWKLGPNTVRTTETGTQTINANKTQSATGTKDYIVGTITGSWSAWSNSGALHTCGSWSPAVNTVNHGTVFTQTAACKQNQTRTRTIYNDWKLGPNTVKTTETGTQTINANKTQSATGTKDYIVGTITGSWSSWSNSGGLYSCGTWSPDPSTVNKGQKFTQTRSCKQNQTRTRTIYNDWKVGANTVKTTETGNQTINVSQSQQATGTKVVYGSWVQTVMYDSKYQSCYNSPIGVWGDTDERYSPCVIGDTARRCDEGYGMYGGGLYYEYECR